MQQLLHSRRVVGSLLCGAVIAAVAATPAVAAVPSGVSASPLWGLPFLGLLLSLGFVPLLAPRFWHRRRGSVMLFWVVALLLPQAAVISPVAAISSAWQALFGEWLPFVALLAAMFTLGGGILVQGGPWGTPLGNTLLLALGTLVSGIVGPIAASMVLIHPLLGANVHRSRRAHLVVFFIILVANVGGVVTPLGNPPLYLGLLQGVPYFWPLAHLLVPLLTVALPVLLVFWLLDRHLAQKASPPERQPLRLRGGGNLALLAVLSAVVVLQGRWHGGALRLFGAELDAGQALAVLVCGATLAASVWLTPPSVRAANRFTWAPVHEVAALFAAIFITLAPVVSLLQAGTDGPFAALVRLVADADNPRRAALACFWLAGTLSAFLDNAPTYLLFFKAVGRDAAYLTTVEPRLLAALSAGSVMFGALTYLGNAPNLLLQNIAAHKGVKMPGFFLYMAFACALLLPIFVLVTILNFL
jgi:Na+/H+ antiporter NhaD/arsenite permease-like protein